MTRQNLYDFTSNVLRMAFKTITPWKKNKYTQDSQAWSEQRYVDGWNDCLKEIKKNRAKYLKDLIGYIDENNL